MHREIILQIGFVKALKKGNTYVAFLFISLFVPIDSIAQGVIINEIMYAPSSGKPEWIELYNASSQPVDIQNWIIFDATSPRPVITANSYVIEPDGYVVIAKDATILSEWPALTPHLIVMDRIPVLNNTGDDITLARSDTSTIDYIRYQSSWGGSNGKSLERIDPLSATNTSSNWGTSLAAGGATPGERNSIALSEHDLMLKSASTLPAYPRVGQPFSLTLLVKNNGTQPADVYRILCYEDRDRNGIGDVGELLLDQTGLILQPQEERSVPVAVPQSSTNERIFLSEIDYASDANHANNKRVDTVRCGLAANSIVINEIMYAPTGGEPEWIELLNAGNSTIDLSKWKIGDASTTKEITDASLTLDPQQYLVISSSASITDYHAAIPAQIVLISIPSLNNTGDEVRLFDHTGFLMDSMSYKSDWGGTDGKSLERVHALFSSTERMNWLPSVDAERSTPGRKNSVSIRDRDIAVRGGFVSGSSVIVTTVNVGLQSIADAKVILYHDENGDGVPDATELRSQQTVSLVSTFDSVRVTFSGVVQSQGAMSFIIVADFSGDKQLSNNVTFIYTKGILPRGALALNEIMFAPLPQQAEWVEYVNTTDETVNVQGFSLTSAPGSDGKRTLLPLPNTPVRVPVKGYLVIASDTSILARFPYLRTEAPDRVVVFLNRSSLNLGNGDDEVVLLDAFTNSIDSVRYSTSWHNPNIPATTGFSLERLNPAFAAQSGSSWSTSANNIGGTPGLRNSLFTEKPDDISDGEPSMTFSPNPFSPDNDGFEDFCVITYRLPANVSQIRLRVYDSVGRLVRTLANNVPAGSEGQFLLDGLDDDKQRLRIGMYIVLLEGIGIANSITSTVKKVVVVASRL